jgi:hypothetical protein
MALGPPGGIHKMCFELRRCAAAEKTDFTFASAGLHTPLHTKIDFIIYCPNIMNISSRSMKISINLIILINLI